MTKLKFRYIVIAMETDAPYFTFACVRQDMSWGSERDAHQSDDKDWLEKASDMVREFSKDKNHERVVPRFCKVLDNGKIDSKFSFELV